MKKIFLTIICLALSLTASGCFLFEGDESSLVDGKGEDETLDNEDASFEFSEDYLPSEVHVEAAEAVGYTLMPVDGEKLLYKYHDDEAGISEIYFVYRKPIEELETFSSVTVSLKLLNPFLHNHEDLIENYYNNGLGEAERIKTQGDKLLENFISTKHITVKAHKSYAKSINGVMIDDTWETDDGILLEAFELYVIKIEAAAITDDNYDTLVDGIYTYLDEYIEAYRKAVSEVDSMYM